MQNPGDGFRGFLLEKMLALEPDSRDIPGYKVRNLRLSSPDDVHEWDETRLAQVLAPLSEVRT
jgi:hypothetical protein